MSSRQYHSSFPTSSSRFPSNFSFEPLDEVSNSSNESSWTTQDRVRNISSTNNLHRYAPNLRHYEGSFANDTVNQTQEVSDDIQDILAEIDSVTGLIRNDINLVKRDIMVQGKYQVFNNTTRANSMSSPSYLEKRHRTPSSIPTMSPSNILSNNEKKSNDLHNNEYIDGSTEESIDSLQQKSNTSISNSSKSNISTFK